MRRPQPPRTGRRTRAREAAPCGHVGMLALVLALGLVGTLGACASTVPPVQRLDRYAPLLERPLPERVQPADEAVLERAHATNLDYGEDVRPRAAAPQHPLAPMVRRVLGDLPPEVTRLAKRHLAAVYLVEGDVGTATTEGVQDAAGRWRYAYIVLNLTALERDANAWATWKERSAFRPSRGHELRMTIERDADDDRAGAVRFILLHELGHVLGLGLGVHGYWDSPEPLPPLATRLSPFARLSWRLEEPEPGPDPRAADGGAGEGAASPLRLVSRYAESEPALSDVGFYRFGRAQHALAEAPTLYAALERTNFPSLYGTLNVYDDFAEAFAIYVHTAMLRRPYRVEVRSDGDLVRTYRSCIRTGTCEAKIGQVKALLAGTAKDYPQLGTAGDRGDGHRGSGPTIRVRMGVGIGIIR